MASESAPYVVVFSLEEILPDVTEKMEMADIIRYPGKDLIHGSNDAGAHVMDQCNWFPIHPFQFLEERDDGLFLFGGKLY
jgi:hypothetical protein